MKGPSAETVTLEAGRPGYGGITVSRLDDKAVLVTGAIPGEKLRARIVERKKDYLRAAAVEIIEPSPDRAEPPCRYFGRCGGCQLQYVSYPRQVRLKEDVLRDCLRRIAGIEPALDGPLTGEPWGYRLGARFKVARGAAGFYRERSRELVDIDACPLMADRVNGLFAAAKPMLRGHDVGELRIACGEPPVASVKAGRGSARGWDELADRLIGCGLSGVSITAAARNPRITGSRFTLFPLSGLGYTVSPDGFFQSNWALNTALVGLVADALGPLAGMTVLDLYAGAGNFALPLAGHAKSVIAVEESPAAVEDGRRNASLNGISNCRFIRSDAESLRLNEKADVVVVDPPRSGLGPKTAGMIAALGPERIAYVSCDPATLSRDLKYLAPRYEVSAARLVDFFPQTYHIETAAFLRLKYR